MSRRKPNPKFPLVLAIGGGVLLIITAILIGLQNTSNAIPQTSASQLGGEDTYPEIQRVSLEDAKAAYDAGSAVFVDVRAVDSYNISHIPGALNIPLANTQERLGELDKAKWIITYCT
jgi:3-mercaptopyruvate sulfurtransferase SseA